MEELPGAGEDGLGDELRGLGGEQGQYRQKDGDGHRSVQELVVVSGRVGTVRGDQGFCCDVVVGLCFGHRTKSRCLLRDGQCWCFAVAEGLKKRFRACLGAKEE